MRIIIFGGAGFLGKKLALKLLEKGKISAGGKPAEPIKQITVFDRALATGLPDDPRLEILAGDICDEAAIRALLSQPVDVIFHLAAIVSGEAEKNFELGMNVNLHASLQLLELCRELNRHPVLVFASSCAIFGGELSETIRDDTAPTPQSSYGTQKAIVDLLLNDYSRRRFIDGRALRLPTIVVRPGKPNAATSSFASSIIREPLQGQRASCPVSGDTKVWLLSPRRVTDNFIHAAELPAEKLGRNRNINLPGITVTVNEMVDSLKEVGGADKAELIDWEPDAFIQSIVLTWPPQFITERALELGFQRDNSVREIIESFIKDELA
jgi:nucleoside-diphosphate-sugar epimerase